MKIKTYYKTDTLLNKIKLGLLPKQWRNWVFMGGQTVIVGGGGGKRTASQWRVHNQKLNGAGHGPPPP